jgi:hypothetical protein
VLDVTGLPPVSKNWTMEGRGGGASNDDVRWLWKHAASSEVGGVLCCRDHASQPVPTPSPTAPTIAPTPAPTIWTSYLNYTGELSLEFERIEFNDELADTLYRWNAALVCLAVLLTMIHFTFFYTYSCRKLVCGIGAHPKRVKEKRRVIEYKSRKSVDLDPDCIDKLRYCLAILWDKSWVFFRVLQRWYFHTLLRCPWLMMLVVLVPTAMTVLALLAEGMQVDAALSSVRLEGDLVTTRFEGLKASLQYTGISADFNIMNDSTFGLSKTWRGRRMDERGGAGPAKGAKDLGESRMDDDDDDGMVGRAASISGLLGLSSEKQRWRWQGWDMTVGEMARSAAGLHWEEAAEDGDEDRETVGAAGRAAGRASMQGSAQGGWSTGRRRLGDVENMIIWMYGNEGEDMLRKDVLTFIDAFNQKVLAIDGGSNPVVGADGVLKLLPLLDLSGTDEAIKAAATTWAFRSYESLGYLGKDFDLVTGESRAVKLIYAASGTTTALNSFAKQLILLLEEEEPKMVALDVQYAFAGNSFWVAAITQALFNDMKLAGGSITFVFICLLCHTHSFLLAFAAVVHIVVSFPSAYFVYRVVFGIQWMGILNFMCIFVIIGIGADNIFICFDAMQRARKSGKYETEKERVMAAIAESAPATAVTTFTTTIAFGSNGISKVGPLRVCGYFAATAVIANYILTFTWFIGCLVLYERMRDCCPCCCCCSAKTPSGSEKGDEEEWVERRVRKGNTGDRAWSDEDDFDPVITDDPYEERRQQQGGPPKEAEPKKGGVCSRCCSGPSCFKRLTSWYAHVNGPCCSPRLLLPLLLTIGLACACGWQATQLQPSSEAPELFGKDHPLQKGIELAKDVMYDAGSGSASSFTPLPPAPSAYPTKKPTSTHYPTTAPTMDPTPMPTTEPTFVPTALIVPTLLPTLAPTPPPLPTLAPTTPATAEPYTKAEAVTPEEYLVKVQLVWGVQGADISQADKNNAEDFGVPLWDPNFDLADPRSQLALFETCELAKNLTGLVRRVDLCFIDGFRSSLLRYGLPWPVTDRGMFEILLARYMQTVSEEEADTVRFLPNGRVGMVYIEVFSEMKKFEDIGDTAKAFFNDFENFMAKRNAAAGTPPTLKGGYHYCEEWLMMRLQSEIVSGLVISLSMSLTAAFFGVLLFTMQFRIAFLSFFSLVIMMVRACPCPHPILVCDLLSSASHAICLHTICLIFTHSPPRRSARWAVCTSSVVASG